MHRLTHRSITIGGLGRRPLLTVGLVALATTAIALHVPPIAAVLATAGVLCLFFIPPMRRNWGALLAAVLFLLSGAAQRHIRELPLHTLVGRTDTITACVTDTPRSGQMYTVEVQQADRIPVGTRLSLYCAPGHEPQRDDVVEATVYLEAANPTQYADRVFLRAFPQGDWDAATTVVGRNDPAPLYELRLYFDDVLRHSLPEQESDLLSALCLGQRGAVSADVDDAFRYSGLSHLLVVSGLHLSMVAVSLRWLLRRLRVGYRLAAVLTIPLIWAFAGMVGGSPSVLRAAVMCSVWLIGFMVYRRHNGLNAWGFAAAVLLMMDPYCLLDIGFQLSFAATAGVLLIAPRLARYPTGEQPPDTVMGRLWRGARLYVRNGLAVCFGALLFTLPITVFRFHSFSITSPPANLLAVVPAGWALTIGWVGILLHPIPWIAQPLLYAAGLLTRWMYGVARFFGLPELYVYTPYLWQKLLITTLCIVIALGILYRISWRRVVAFAATACLCITGVSMPWMTPPPVMTVLARGAHTAVLLQEDDTAVLILDHSQALRDISYELQQRGITQLQAIFIDRGDAANGGTLTHLWEQYGRPTVYSASAEDWCDQQRPPVCRADPTDTWTWGSATLLHPADGWWQWQDALICTDPSVPCPNTAPLYVYTALPTAWPSDGHCVVSYYHRKKPAVPIGDNVLLLTEEELTLTAESGEWSVLPWL